MARSSVKYLPQNFHHYKTLNLHDSKSSILMNLVAIVILVATIKLSEALVNFIRPGITYPPLSHIAPFPLGILYILGISTIVITVHELIHAAFFWISTREIPVFAFKFLYAFAAAPDWYIPKYHFVIIGLSPLVLVTLLAMFLIMIVPASIISFVTLAGIINFAGSTGDLIVVIWVLAQPGKCLLRDSGDSFDVYLPFDRSENSSMQEHRN